MVGKFQSEKTIGFLPFLVGGLEHDWDLIWFNET